MLRNDFLFLKQILSEGTIFFYPYSNSKLTAYKHFEVKQNRAVPVLKLWVISNRNKSVFQCHKKLQWSMTMCYSAQILWVFFFWIIDPAEFLRSHFFHTLIINIPINTSPCSLRVHQTLSKCS